MIKKATASGLASLVIAVASMFVTAAPAPAASGEVALNSVESNQTAARGGVCAGKSKNHVVRKYYRGLYEFRLKCGTKSWGWRHIAHRWNRHFAKRIGAVLANGTKFNGGYQKVRYDPKTCKTTGFRVVIKNPSTDIVTAYRVG